jgi:Na+-driven multidrug efflux pump
LAKKITQYGLAISAVLMLASLVFYKPIGNIFSNENSVLEVFYAVFFILILGLPINTVAFVLDGLFKGLGEMKYLRNVLLFATFLGFVPVLFIGKHLGWGLTGIWIAFTIWMIIRGGALVWKFRQKFRPLLRNP